MKPERVDLGGVTDVNELIDRVLRTRLREARTLSPGLARRDKQGLHEFRIACKRLRYALERFENLKPSLQLAAERLADLQDALGEAHDRDVLLTILPASMGATERRLRTERDGHVDRAVTLWSELQQLIAALDSHAI
jgi:CHAD domain-containing protein